MARRSVGSRRMFCAVLAAASLAAGNAFGVGVISSSGDVSPANPATWTTSTNGYIGNILDGAVTVTGGATLASDDCAVGYGSAASGTLTITGSNLNCRDSLVIGQYGTGTGVFNGGSSVSCYGLYVGDKPGSHGVLTVDSGAILTTSSVASAGYVGKEGDGTLNITNSGRVLLSGRFYITNDSRRTALVNFGAHGGTLSCTDFYGSPSQLTGTGTLIAKGMVTDGELLFDVTHGTNQTFLWNGANQSVTVKLNMSGNVLGVGYRDSGALTIKDGVSVTSSSGYVGYGGSTATAVVEGTGSAWTCTGELNVGAWSQGNCSMTVTNGGSVVIGTGILGGRGTATVDGTGSTWTCNSTLLFVPGGTLNVFNGGRVAIGGSLGLAANTASTGIVNFGSSGGTLTTQSLYVARAQVMGTGTINARGMAFDGELRFDGAHGLKQAMNWNDEQKNVLVNLDLSGDSGAGGDLAVGNTGAGTLTIGDGMVVNAATGVVGFGAPGLATVSGTSSSWSCSGSLTVGLREAGTLRVEGGGKAISNGIYCFIGKSTGVAGTVIVDGTGSSMMAREIEVGGYGNGVLNITHGGVVSSNSVYIGRYSNAMGSGTVDGTGSSWSIVGSLTLCGSGVSGALNITNGGLVSVSGTTYVGNGTGSTGSLCFGDHGGTLTTTAFFGSPSQITGVGTLNTSGLVSDGTLVFDGTHGLDQTWTWNNDQENVTVNLSANSGTLGVLGSGYLGTGELAIGEGAAVKSGNGFLGYCAGSAGTAAVAGASSTWTCSGTLTVGNSGTGALSISNGGSMISSGGGYLGSGRGSFGTVTVDGTGSAWTSGFLYAGNSGAGTLSISNGGTVSSGNGCLGYGGGSSGTATVEGAGSAWTCSSLNVGYSGTGVLTVSDGAKVSNTANGILGNNTGSSGTVTVDGAGSTWTCGGNLTIGNSGAGVLNITNGGLVTSASTTIANGTSSTGSLCFGDRGGTLTTGTFWGSPAQITGVGTINARSLINDGMLLFDATHGDSQSWSWINDQENVTVNLTSVNGTFGIMGAGYLGSGSLVIRDGVAVKSGNGYLGYGAGSSGSAVVSGTSSTWTCSGSLTVGNFGAGNMTIANGGSASNMSYGYLGYGAGSSGTVTVDGVGSKWACNGALYAGNLGNGALAVTHGGSVTNFNDVILGYLAGSSGAAVVDGVGSMWTCNRSLTIGNYGAGVLHIGHGGKVSNSGYGILGYYPNSTGVVTVDGTGSTWTCSGSLTVGSLGTGTLKISNGGTVTANSGVSIGSLSMVALNVGDNSRLAAGPLNNFGVIRLAVAANASAGMYTPIMAGSWAGTGAVQALGGKWNTSSHMFTVSAAQAGVPGVGVTIDRLAKQRVVITDGTSGDCVVAGFLATTSSTNLTLTGLELTGAEEGALVRRLPAGTGVLEGWTFSTSGYTAGEAVYLSMKVGGGWSTEQLGVWHFDGGGWVPYGVGDMSYDGAYASFTVYGFSGYAVTGVPEASTLGVLALGMVGVLGRRRRRVGRGWREG